METVPEAETSDGKVSVTEPYVCSSSGISLTTYDSYTTSVQQT